MREISNDLIIEAVRKLCINSNYNLGKDIFESLEKSIIGEKSQTGKQVLNSLIENARIAACENVPICQDTGMTVVFIELGQDLHINGGLLKDAVNEGVRRGYTEGYLRKSVVGDPIIRKNTNDNTPAVIHCDIVEGDGLKIIVMPKGFGSENMSRLAMLKPSDGVEGVRSFILDTVHKAGPNPCPPVIVGVGLGGTMEMAALLSKKALLRPLGEYSTLEHIAELEKQLLKEINRLGIGPAGTGGSITALGLNIETYPTHIAGLPVAVNICCHACRHAEVEL